MRLPAVVFLAALAVASVPVALPARAPQAAAPPGSRPTGSAVIRGLVTAEATGEPLRRALVRALSGAATVTSAHTTAEGRFEILNLPAGRYTVTASKTGFVTIPYGRQPFELSDGQVVDTIALALPRAAAISGRIVDDAGDPAWRVEVTAWRYAYQAGQQRLVTTTAEGGSVQTDDRGAYRLYGLPPGEYVISAMLRSIRTLGPPFDTPPEGFARTFFPGTEEQSAAQRVTLGAGQDRQDVSFALVAAKLSRISGRAVASSGRPHASAVLEVRNLDRGLAPGPSGTTPGMVRSDGRFEVSGVPPGRYALTLRPLRSSGQGTADLEIGRRELTVSGEDIDDVLVTTAPGGIARGRIVTDAGVAPGFTPSRLRLSVQTVDPAHQTPGLVPLPRVNQDFSFEVRNLIDRAVLRVSAGALDAWSLKHVFSEGTDILETGFAVRPGEILEGLRVVITDKVTDVSGTAIDGRKRPAAGATIVLFPADRGRWTHLSRYLQTARADASGRYRIRVTPHDDYLLIAVQDLEEGRSADPEFLELARAAATRLAIGEGERKVIDLQVQAVR